MIKHRKDTNKDFADWKIEDYYESKHNGKTIVLLTPCDLEKLKVSDPEKVLISIRGNEVKAKDANDDAFGGLMPFGILKEDV